MPALEPGVYGIDPGKLLNTSVPQFPWLLGRWFQRLNELNMCPDPLEQNLKHSKCYISVGKTRSNLPPWVAEMIKGIFVRKVFRIALGTQ